jgi:intraflagellar transport protein 140
MFDEAHGSPAFMDIARDFLVVVTNSGSTRVLKVAGREAKPHAGELAP